MSEQVDRLTTIAQETEELLLRGEQLSRDFHDATTGNAVRMLGLAAQGFRRAIDRLYVAAEREEEKRARLAHWESMTAKKAEDRKYDEIVHLLAKRRGISLEEAQAIKDAAGERARQAAAQGSIAEQMSKLKPS